MARNADVMPAMEQLITCLCSELAGRPELPPLCFCGVVWGDQVPADYVQDGNGMAYVRLVSGFPSANFANPHTDPGCAMPLAFTLEMGVMFCPPMPAGNDARDLPTIRDHLEAARIAASAMDAMFTAVLCCFDSDNKDIVIGTYSPVGPQGMVVGGTLQITVESGIRWQEDQ